eukprot:jgi/Chlat1/4077/Chrsp26S08850
MKVAESAWGAENGAALGQPQQARQGDRVRVTGFRLWVQQTWALLNKNFLLAVRNRRATLLQLASSFFFILIIFAVAKAIDATISNFSTYNDNLVSPPTKAANSIPACTEMIIRDTSQPCLDFIYSPLDPASVINTIVSNIRLNNVPPIPADRVLGFATRDEVDAYLLSHPQTVQGAYEFVIEDSATTINFGLQTNSTAQFFRGQFQDPTLYAQLPMQQAAEREIVRYLRGDSSIDWQLYLREFAHPPFDTFSLVGAIAPGFLFAAAMFAFVLQMSALVAERENKLRMGMRTMGMQESAYWASWLLWEALLAAIFSILLILFGMLFQLRLFLHNDFGVLFIFFFLFELAMTSIAFALSAFISKSSTATSVGFFIFIIMFILQLVVQFGFPYDKKYGKGWRIAFSLFPPALLVKGLLDLGQATNDPSYKGISWGNRGSYCDNLYPFTSDDSCLFMMDAIYKWFVAEWIVWFILAIYFDNIIKDESGNRKPVYYFLSPGYWCGTSMPGCWPRRREPDFGPAPDEDVQQEEVKMRSSSAGTAAVEVRGLVKSYGRFSAVKGNWFGVEKDKLFCLLGPNGAGKTTTISMLTGVVPPTAGHAFVFGESITSPTGMGRVRSFMGVCPQFDILWSNLTGIEHLYIFGLLKGIRSKDIQEESQQLLSRVQLTGAQFMPTGKFSGGMKRRLSVAIALIGDPKVVYLDEPTTGMDPISRRYVWDIIEAAKPGRAIILTTHSMEEADILGDRIAIMAKGRLRCIGTSIQLKRKFGAGYRMSVSVRDRMLGSMNNLSTASPKSRVAEQQVRQFFLQELGLEPVEETGTYLHYGIPKQQEQQLSDFMTKLRDRSAELQLADIQLSLTTLDEASGACIKALLFNHSAVALVFLRISREAELEVAQTDNRFEQVQLPDGRYVPVPIGAERVAVPDTETAEMPFGLLLNVQWAQDESGTLAIANFYVEAADQRYT